MPQKQLLRVHLMFCVSKFIHFASAGTKQVKYLESNAAAFFVKLSKKEVQYLSDLFKPENVRPSTHCS